MIAYLKGEVLEIQKESLILLCGAVGYEVHCSQNTLQELQVRQEVNLFVYTSVTENSFRLFGFISLFEKQVFCLLLIVKGVGPAMATKILSGDTPENILSAIQQADIQTLCRLPKVGKKLAEEIVFKLKQKVMQINVPSSHVQIRSMLSNLEFKDSDIQEVLAELPSTIDVEEGVRRCLRELSTTSYSQPIVLNF